MTTSPRRPARRALRALTPVPGLVAVLVVPALLAAPAHADVPVGWSDPAPVSAMDLILVLLVFPLVAIAVVSLVYLVPGFVRGEGFTGRDEHADDQWFGGRRSTHELASPAEGDERAITGGASGTW